MKKRLAIIISLAMLMAVLTGCSGDAELDHAVVTVTTSAGNYCSTTSVNSVVQAEDEAIWVVNNEEENVSVFFSCPSCKYEETWEASTLNPESKLFMCECVGENGKIGRPEYFCVFVTNGEQHFGNDGTSEED